MQLLKIWGKYRAIIYKMHAIVNERGRLVHTRKLSVKILVTVVIVKHS